MACSNGTVALEVALRSVGAVDDDRSGLGRGAGVYGQAVIVEGVEPGARRSI